MFQCFDIVIENIVKIVSVLVSFFLCEFFILQKNYLVVVIESTKVLEFDFKYVKVFMRCVQVNENFDKFEEVFFGMDWVFIKCVF